MKKEEVLAKSRRENTMGDEREIKIRDKSFVFSSIFVLLISFGLSIMEVIYRGSSWESTQFPTIASGMAAFCFLYRAIKYKHLSDYAVFIILLICFVLSAVRFVTIAVNG